MRLCELDGQGILALEILIAVSLLDGLNADEANFLGNILSTVSGILKAQASYMKLCPHDAKIQEPKEIDLREIVLALERRLTEMESKLK